MYRCAASRLRVCAGALSAVLGVSHGLICFCAAAQAPAPSITWTLSLRPTRITLGEPVAVALVLHNASQKDLYICGGVRLDLSLDGPATETPGSRRNPPRPGRWRGPIPSVPLRAGTRYARTEVLNRQIRIGTPGTHEIRIRSVIGLSPTRTQRQRSQSGEHTTIRLDELRELVVLPQDVNTLRSRADALFREIEAAKPWQRTPSIRALASIEHPLVIPFLLKAMDLGRDVGGIAVQALTEFDEPEAVKGVVRAIQNRNCGGRMAALNAVAHHVGEPEFREAIVGCLADPDHLVRTRALEALRGCKDPAIWRRVAQVLRDPFPSVRLAAAETLGATGDPSIVGDLQIALAREHWSPARQQIKTALTALGHPPEPPPTDARSLIAMLDSTHLDDRSEAVLRLAELNTAEARAGLVKALNSSCTTTRSSAMSQAQRLKVKEAGDVLMLLLENEEPMTRARAGIALASIKHDGAAPAVARLLFDGDRSVRFLTPGSLAALGDPSVIPALQKAVQGEKDQQVAEHMRNALRRLEWLRAKRTKSKQ